MRYKFLNAIATGIAVVLYSIQTAWYVVKDLWADIKFVRCHLFHWTMEGTYGYMCLTCQRRLR